MTVVAHSRGLEQQSGDTTIDQSRKNNLGENTNTFSEIKRFGGGIWHGMAENPINGTVQIANRLTGMHLPELHLVDQQSINSSAAGRFGTILGTAANGIALTLATGGIGSAGYMAAAMRAGAIGATMSGVLQPSDIDSKTFWKDRLTSGAVGGITGVAAIGSAAALDSLGTFAVPMGRSLLGSMAYGSLTAGGAGIGFAESKAVFKGGKLFPSARELYETEKTFMTIGGIAGAAGYGYFQATKPAPRIIDVEAPGRIRIWSDRGGNPYKIESYMDPPYRNTFSRLEFKQDVLHTNGKWGAVNQELNQIPQPMGVKVAGDGTIKLTHPNVTIKPDGGFEVHSFRNSVVGEKFGQIKKIETNDVMRQFDPDGRLISISPMKNSTFNGSPMRMPAEGSRVHYTDDGQIESLSIPRSEIGSSSIDLKLNSNGTYRVDIYDYTGRNARQTFEWKGSIKVVQPNGQASAELQLSTPTRQFAVGADPNSKAIAEALVPLPSTPAR